MIFFRFTFKKKKTFRFRFFSRVAPSLLPSQITIGVLATRILDGTW